MKRTLCILLSLMLAVTGLAGLCMTASATNVGDIILFGNYPQTKVGETTALKNAANAATWKSYGYYIGNDSYDGSMAASDYMKYADFVSGGVKFRAVKFTKYRPISTYYTSSTDKSWQDNNGYSPNTTYYFKYEPIEWRVLDPSAGLVLCETIIDAQAYQNVVRKSASDNYYIGSSSTYANNYAESSIRTWLNNDFYNTAFNTAQKNKIESTTLNNDAARPEDSKYNSASTTDPIFFLSYSEVQNNSYGLSSDSERKGKNTDYAKCQGIADLFGFSDWYLRTPGDRSYHACDVDYNGDVGFMSGSVSYTYTGIRPACRLSNLTSDTSQIENYTVTATANPTAGGTVTGGGTYTDGTTATLTATANSGYLFSGWYKGSTKVSSNKSYTFTVTENVTLTAKFYPLSMNYTVTATADPTAGGTVTGGGSYSAGNTATVTATPKSGWHFTGWFDGSNKVSSDASYSFTVTGNVTLTAKFEKDAQPKVVIRNFTPSSKKYDYRSTIGFHADVEDALPGGEIRWYVDDAQVGTGNDYSAENVKKSFKLQARYFVGGAEIQEAASGVETVNVNTGFFAKLKAFFRGLFGRLPKEVQEYLGAEIIDRVIPD